MRGEVIGIDCALRKTGVAYIDSSGVLRGTFLINLKKDEPFDFHGFLTKLAELTSFEERKIGLDVVIETPYRYPHERTDPLILMRMSQRAGEISGCLKAQRTYALAAPQNVHYVHPHTWKGNIKKEMMTARILKHLLDMEKALIPQSKAGKYQEDIVDAIGIARWWQKQETV